MGVVEFVGIAIGSFVLVVAAAALRGRGTQPPELAPPADRESDADGPADRNE